MSMTRREALQVGGIMAGTVVLPIIWREARRSLPWLPPIGAMTEEGLYKPVDQLQWVAPGSLVRYRIRWDEVEIAPGVYDWTRHDAFMAACPHPVMVNVICTPMAYRLYPAYRCSPPRPEYSGRLVAFIRALVERYHPAALEFWNEPEISAPDASGINADHVLGGFGDTGAYYYGDLLSQVWRAFQEGWYSTWLVAGSIMASSTLWWERARTRCDWQYDAISYHAYVIYPNADYDSVRRGADLLRASGEIVPIILSETALICDTDSPLFRDAQANYLHYQVVNRINHGLHSLIWYPLDTNAWHNSDMVLLGVPKPVWYEYQEVMR